MKTYVALAATAALLGLAGPSLAARITSSAFPTGTNTASACYIRNVGSTPVSLQATMFQFFGAEIAPSFQNCNGAPLAPGRTCVVLVNDLPDDVVAACGATVAGSARNLRASFELRQITASGLRVLAAEDLR